MKDTDEQLLTRMRDIEARGDEAAMEAFFAEVDALDAAREERLGTPGALAQTALWYAINGIAVFRLQPRSKMPLPGSRGFKDAVSDPATVRRWWTEMPDANIGLPTGHRFDVIDVDPPAGAMSLIELRDAGAIPDLIGKAYTPRGGRHLFIRPTGDGNTTAILPGVDYRGLGGYVVAAPSIGASGQRYDWLQPLDVAALVKAA